jgi:hypothetical protein
MAKIPPSSPLHGLSGRIGNLIYRQVNGETIVQAYTPPQGEPTEAQRQHANKMRQASMQAKAALEDLAVRSYYEKKTKRLNASNAYVAALTDILRNGCIDKIGKSKKKKGLLKGLVKKVGAAKVTGMI